MSVKNGATASGGRSAQRHDVRARHQQHVALKQRPCVEERDVVVVLVDDRRGQLLLMILQKTQPSVAISPA